MNKKIFSTLTLILLFATPVVYGQSVGTSEATVTIPPVSPYIKISEEMKFGSFVSPNEEKLLTKSERLEIIDNSNSGFEWEVQVTKSGGNWGQDMKLYVGDLQHEISDEYQLLPIDKISTTQISHRVDFKLLALLPKNVKAGEYKTSLTWNLILNPKGIDDQ